LTINIEVMMQEMDSYIKITKKINSYKVANQMDTVLVNSLERAVEKIASEAGKKAEIKAGQIDLDILESKLRKPIKDILFQCIRNSIYHGIEDPEERINKKKRALGLLVFSIKKTEGKAELTFSDDGRGLNWDKIRTKYLLKNPNAGAIDKKILLNTLFSPEFSTADEVSTQAGRGVGLSLVMDIVKSYQGNINVNSTDTGLTFRFLLSMPK